MSTIHYCYAYTEDAQEKSLSNAKRYMELIGLNSVYIDRDFFDLQDGFDCNFSKFDLVIGSKRGKGPPSKTHYHIYKNSNFLSLAEIALICDGGRLCFDFEADGRDIVVYEELA